MSNPPNCVKLLVDGHEILPSLLADLRVARSSIHISMFLWFRDPIGEEIADVVIAKARDGVLVRVLINVEKTGMGDPFSTGERKMIKHDPSVDHDPLDVEPMCLRMREAGVEVVDTNIDYDKELPSLRPRLRSIAAQIRETIEIDDMHIDHRKIVVVDGNIGYCGGANIGAQYMYHVPFQPEKDACEEGEERKKAGLSEPWWKWHDSLTRFEGPIVRKLEEHFHERFVLDGGTDYEATEPIVHDDGAASREGALPIASAEAFANQPDDQPNAVRDLYVRLIAGAARSIFIENPYFYHPALVDALCAAKKRNPALDVKLVLPAENWNDNSFSADAQQHEYSRYLECGIEIYEYQCHFNHLKMAVFDERFSFHGSTNGNYRSLENDKDFELGILVDDEALARDVLARVRDVDLTRSKRITEKHLEGFDGFRVRHRDPRTLLLVSRCEL